jgi:pyruvate dehydrogenase E1 component
MMTEQEDIYYYITLMNENYAHPAMPQGAEKDILKGMYHLQSVGDSKAKLRVQLLGSGTIFREVMAAAQLLKEDWGVASDLWSCPSFTELARDIQRTQRHNLLNPTAKSQKSHVEESLTKYAGPVIASTDYVRLFAEQIRPAIQQLGRSYTVLGTDGYGRSDTRENLRHFFEVDRYWVTLSALKALADNGQLEAKKVAEAITKYGLDISKPNPMTI